MSRTPKPTRELIANMRGAAEVLQEVSRIYYGDDGARDSHAIDWRPVNLASVAKHWETELDAEDATLLAVESVVTEYIKTPIAAALSCALVERFDVKPKGGNAS